MFLILEARIFNIRYATLKTKALLILTPINKNAFYANILRLYTHADGVYTYK